MTFHQRCDDSHGEVPQRQRVAADGLFALALATCCLLAVWLVVLPAIGQVPVVRRDIDRVNAAGIDASALYWTDLDDSRLWKRQQFGAATTKADRLHRIERLP